MNKVMMALLCTVAMVPAALANESVCRAQSPAHQVSLIELYSSEGCDSCPPADRWLRALPAAGVSQDQAVAVAFHVDYWDRLGWKDRFADPAFTARQWEAARHNRETFVYTPQVVVNGRDFTAWRDRRALDNELASRSRSPSRAEIKVAAAREAGNDFAVDVHVQVSGANNRADAKVFVALVQSDLVSRVTAGENSGARLEHDHVVRQWTGPLAIDATGQLQKRVALARPRDAGPVSIVAWVETATSGVVLQAIETGPCETL